MTYIDKETMVRIFKAYVNLSALHVLNNKR